MINVLLVKLVREISDITLICCFFATFGPRKELFTGWLLFVWVVACYLSTGCYYFIACLLVLGCFVLIAYLL